MRFSAIVALGLTLALTLVEARAGRFTGTPAAQAEIAKAKTLEQTNDWAEAAKVYRHAIDLDPEFTAAHEGYIWALHRAALGDLSRLTKMSAAEHQELETRLKAKDDALIKEYEDLVRAHPTAPIYKWALAQNYNETNIDLQERLCRESVALDATFSPGYNCLATAALVRGDIATAEPNLRRVMAIDGESNDQWLRLQRSVREVPDRYKAVTDEITSHMPGTDTAAEALEAYAESQPTARRIPAFEHLISTYPPAKFSASSHAAAELFAYYDTIDPVRAANLAHSVAAAMPKDNAWKGAAAYSDAMAAAEKQISTDAQGALTTLKTVKVPSSVSRARLQLLTARATDRAGNTAAAYGDLVKAFAAEPLPQVEPAIYEYGAKLNKNHAAVDAEIVAARSAAAKPATPFSLESFVDGKTVSLSDFSGRVVLLDFWYPNCGPCRGSMPYLQQLWHKYQDQGLVFLGINGLENQAPQVMPLVKNLGWSFTPLKGTEKWADEVYHVRGYPTTFYIGRDGRVYFMTHVYNEATMAIADLEIKALLKMSGR
jgi:thiol-disulfide isomerase/thioredoxin